MIEPGPHGAFTHEQLGRNTLANIGPRFFQAVEQAARARSLTHIEGLNQVVLLFVAKVRLHQQVDVEFVKNLPGGKERGAQIRAGDDRARRLNNTEGGLNVSTGFNRVSALLLSFCNIVKQGSLA